MMCLQCGADIDAGLPTCTDCGQSPYEPPGGLRAPNAPVAPTTAEGEVANAASALLAAPAPPTISVIELSDSQQRRVTFLQQKLDFDPNQPKVLLSMAQVYEEAGDVSTALAYYRGCLEVDHLNGYAAGRIAILEAKHGHLPSPALPFHAQAGSLHGAGADPTQGDSANVVGGGPSSGNLREPGSGALRSAASGTIRDAGSGVLRSSAPSPASGIEPRPTTGTVRPSTGVARPASGYVSRGAVARQQSRTDGKRWYADPRLWAAVVFVLGAGGYLGYWQWDRAHHRVVLGKNRASWGAAFSHDGRYLAVYEPAQKPDLETVVWGFDGAGDANVRVLSAAGGTVLATFPRARVWKGSAGPSWGGGRYVLFPTAGGDGWETRISVGDVQSKVIAMTLDGSNGRLSPDGRFVAYEKGVEVEPDMIGPYRYYSRYKPTRPEIFVFEISARDDRQLTGDGGYDPVWSPDGRTILYRRANTTEYMKQGLSYDRVELDDDSARRELAPRVYSYKAKRFAGVDLMSIPRDGGEPTVVAHGGMNAHAAWVGRDSHTVSWVHWDFEPDSTADGELGGYRSFAYAFGHAADPDTVSLEASLMVGSAAGSEPEEVLSPAHDAIRLSTARWAPDGQRLVYERVISDSTMIVANRRAGAKLGDFKDETDLHLYDRATRRTVRLTGDGNPHRTQPAWSPDGTRLAYMVHEWEIPQVEIATLERLVPRSR